MDFVMYFLLAVVKELGGGFVSVLTVYCFQTVQNVLQLSSRRLTKALWLQWGFYYLWTLLLLKKFYFSA